MAESESTNTTAQPRRLLRMPQVSERTGQGPSSIYEAIAAGKFPKPVKLGRRTSAWVEAEVDAWIAERIAERDATGDGEKIERGAA